MLQFTKSQQVKKGCLYIPYQMRAALALHSGSRIFLSLPRSDANGIVNQLVLSPISHPKQSDLWTLKVVFRDRPRIIAELTSLLRESNLDIVDFRSTTRNQQHELVVHATFDAEFYESDFDGNTGARRKNSRLWLRELHARILAHFIDDLRFRSDGKPNIFIIRNHVLADSLNGHAQRHNAQISNGFVDVPQALVMRIREGFEENYSLEYKSGRTLPLVCSLCIDSGYRLLLATFYFRNTGHVHLRVKAKNEVGAIARFARAVSQAGFNILQANCRDLNSNTALNDFLLHLPPEVDQHRDDKKLRAYVKGILTDNELGDLSPRVTFPGLISRSDIENDQRRT